MVILPSYSQAFFCVCITQNCFMYSDIVLQVRKTWSLLPKEGRVSCVMHFVSSSVSTSCQQCLKNPWSRSEQFFIFLFLSFCSEIDVETKIVTAPKVCRVKSSWIIDDEYHPGKKCAILRKGPFKAGLNIPHPVDLGLKCPTPR